MFEISADFRAAERVLSDLGRRQLPFAAMMAVNDTAKDVLQEVEREIETSFDNPTRFTRKAFFVRRANNKKNPVATVERKTPVAGKHYLVVQSRGGIRPQTGLEKLLANRLKYAGVIRTVAPASGARRNAYGNWSPGQRNQVLSAIKAQRDASSNTTSRSLKRQGGRNGYFVPREGSKLGAGVYQRMARGRVKKIVNFSDAAARYRQRFEFDDVALETAQSNFERHFFARLEKAIRTAKR